MKILILANPDSAAFVTDRITNAWIDYLDKDKRRPAETRKSALPPGEISTISNIEAYESVLNELTHKPEYVFIVPELGWKATTEFFEQGYEKALSLIDGKLKGILLQIVFISIANRAQLLNHTGPRYHSLIKAFPHISLLECSPEKISFERYSNIHFDLIKALAVSDKGKLDKIKHDLNVVKRNIGSQQNAQGELLQLMGELKAYQHFTPALIEFDAYSNNKGFAAQVAKMESLIIELSALIPEHQKENGEGKKTAFRVLIIDDDIPMQKALQNTFSIKFTRVEVFPWKNNNTAEMVFEQAREYITKASGNYDVFILDLMYVNKEKEWLPFSGLDLYDLIRQHNPYAAIRIVTSLPRDVVSRLSEKILRNKIPISHLFTKTEGEEKLKIVLLDRVDEIIEECTVNEKYRLMFKPIPKVGIFTVPGVLFGLHKLMLDEKDEYNGIIEKAYEIFEAAKSDDSYSLTLFQTKAKPAFQDVKNKLPTIMAYRLVLLLRAITTSNGKDLIIPVNNDVYREHKPPRQVSKQLLSTQLGFNVNENKKDGETVSYEILKTNLFPHEYAFISINSSEVHVTVQSGLLEPELMNWFVKIISDGDIYENFDSLNLNISLYDDKATMDSENEVHLLPDSYERLTYHLLDSFLMSIINQIAQPGVLKIAKIVTENYHFEDDKLVAKAITKRLKSHFEMIIEIMP